MKLKKFLVFISALVLVFGLNASSVLAATGVWTIDGVQDYNDSTNTASTNSVAYFNNDAANYCYTVWSQDGTDEGAQISQTVEITEAGTYTLSFYYMGGPESNGPIQVTGFIGDVQGTTETTAETGWVEDPNLWDMYTVQADLEAGTYEVGVVIDMSAINAWGDVDNFTLTDANGTEYLVMGDFGFADDEWTTYVTSNVLDGSSPVVSVASTATDNTDDADADEEDESVDNAEDTSDDAEETTPADTADDTDDDEGGIQTGVVVAVVVVIVIVVAAVAVVLKKKK